MPIYTRTGDKGKTSLFSGKRVWKYDARVEAYGTVDELNSFLGLVTSELRKSRKSYQKYLLQLITGIQGALFHIGASLANPKSRVLGVDLRERTFFFEEKIDEMTEELPALSNFILPGGGRLGALFHVVRSVSRRAERKLVVVSQEEQIDKKIPPYINRLSDLLFTMARFANFKEGKKEIVWSQY